MKKIIFVILCAYFNTHYIFAQNCPTNITFLNQADIDDFPNIYPECTVIAGNVSISGSDITNINSLSQITSIGGTLYMNDNYSLTNLSGLNAITYIGNLFVVANPALTDISGLNAVTNIGTVAVQWNDALMHITGMNSLNTVGTFDVDNNNSLTGLMGLSSLVTVINDFHIQSNTSLTSLLELSNLSSIGGELYIVGNSSLTSCEAQGVCNFLTNPLNNSDISNNSGGCDNVAQVSLACGLSEACPTDITLLSQSDIDSFPVLYPGCTSLLGNVSISGSDITNFNGLSQITYIGGTLYMNDNYSLTNISGLNAVSYIGNLFIVANPALTEISGLNSVTNIGTIALQWNGALTHITGLNSLNTVGTFDVDNNNSLTGLMGLSSLVSVINDFHLQSNTSLTSLLELTALSSIGGGLYIVGNSSLASCEAQGICSFLGNPLNNSDISGNEIGCSNLTEVQIACNLPLTCPTNITFLNQSDIDAFPILYPGCLTIAGNVSISGSDITNFNGLSQITSIGGTLYMNDNYSLTNLTGLNSISYIGNLFIVANPSLTEISGLNAVTNIGTVALQWNDALFQITGLNNLNTVGTLDIDNNNSLTGLMGLSSLVSVVNDFHLQSNASLTSLLELTALSSIGGGLYIVGNSSLTSCEANGICNFLAVPLNNSDIAANGYGCDNPPEVLALCTFPPDFDNDGYVSPTDCNDSNASIYPGATELCNGLDDDCDNSIDNNVSFCPSPAEMSTTDISSTSATLNWSQVPCAKKYKIRYYTIPLGTSGKVIVNAPANSTLIEGLEPSRHYRWFIKTKCGSGNWSAASPWQFFTTPPPNMQTITSELNHNENFPGNSLNVKISTIKLYPNPASDNIRVVSNDENILKIVITDISGRIVWAQSDLNTQDLDLNIHHLDTGLYYMHSQSERQHFVESLIVIH